MRSAALSHCPVHTFGVGGWVEIRIWQLLKIHAAHSKSCFALKLVQFVKSAVFGVGSTQNVCQTKRSKFSFEHIKESNLWYTNILQNQTLFWKVDQHWIIQVNASKEDLHKQTEASQAALPHPTHSCLLPSDWSHYLPNHRQFGYSASRFLSILRTCF